jgi:putative DNA primase/helicase
MVPSMTDGGELYDMAVAAGFVDCLVTEYDKKHPITDWKHSQERHLTAEERAEQRALAERTVNPGFWSPTGGPHGFVAIDPDDQEALHTLRGLVEAEVLDRTVCERTPRGGRHILFSVAGDDRTPNNGPEGIGGIASLHFRGYGGGIKHWPSAGYVMTRFPADGLEPLPDALRQHLRSPNGNGSKVKKPTPAGVISEGQRNDVMFRNVCAQVRRGMSTEAIRAAAHRDNAERFSPPLFPAEVDTIVDQAVQRYEPTPTDADESPLAAARHCTDTGNGERLIDVFGDRIRYCPAWGSWLVWDERRWAKDDMLQIEHLAGLALRRIHNEAAEARSKDAREELGRWALASESAARRRAAIECARSDPRVVVRPDQLDGDPWLFNCLSGTIDLKTGELREHRREDLITKLSPVAFDSSAKLELWDRMLCQATEGNAEMPAFLARLAGYSLTGLTSEEKLPFIYGPEATAKSTFLEALKNTWGDYAQTADFETFLKRSGVGNPRTDLARLAGARLVIAIETEPGTRLADGFVKMITGGDRVVARKLYHDEFEFRPAFTLWWAANDAPRMSDRDGALWRRILEIPFTHQIPEKQRDPHVKATLIDPAVAGPTILAWAVRGCLAWQRDGLGVPPAVARATEQLREEMNPLRDFLAERCLFEEQALSSSKSLYGAYVRWSAANNERSLSRREFGLRLAARGCQSRHRRDGDAWEGIRLLADEALEQSLDLKAAP